MKTILIFDSHPVCLKGFTIVLKKHTSKFRVLVSDNLELFLAMLPNPEIDIVIFGINEIWDFNIFPKQYFKEKNWIGYYTERGEKSALELVRLGAKACISKRCSDQELISGIRNVAGDENYFCKNTFLLLTEELSKKQKEINWEQLSQREKEIANLLVSGMSTTNIAQSLNLASSTVSCVKSRIFKKMHVTNILALNSKKIPS